jgi:hypothetical protein
VKLAMTVRDLRTRMGNEEFVRWNMYYARVAQQQQLEALQRGN